MSQPRRRRRRRGGGANRGRPADTPPQNEVAADGRTGAVARRRRRRRGGGRGPSHPATLEGILASFRTPRDARLTADPDGQDLDLIIGELQSRWGVPQYPQEYRITIKVAEERQEKVERGNGNGSGNGSATAPGPHRCGARTGSRRAAGRGRRRGRRRRGAIQAAQAPAPRPEAPPGRGRRGRLLGAPGPSVSIGELRGP